MTYILILSILWSHAPATTAVEFASKETCEAAKTAVLAELDPTFGSAYAVCVKK